MLGRPPKPTFDAEIGGTLVAVKSGLNTVRDLRAGLLDLAYALQDEPLTKHGLLVVTGNTLSMPRLREEWRLARHTLREKIAARLSFAFVDEDTVQGVPQDPDPAMHERLRKLVAQQSPRTGLALTRVEYYPEILKILLLEWFCDTGPITADALGKMAGCTYPTVARALKRLAPFIKRYSDRRFELSHFPKDPWAGLVALGDRVRHTMNFSYRGAAPRPAEALLERLRRLNLKTVAVGGVPGAKSVFPELDLLGIPRLDLTVHCPKGRLDVSFVRNLDAALKPVQGYEEPTALAIHVIRRRESRFTANSSGLQYADPVECLLDLHEAHLEAQAHEFFTFLTSSRKARS